MIRLHWTLLLVALFLAGCGGGTDESDESTRPAEEGARSGGEDVPVGAAPTAPKPSVFDGRGEKYALLVGVKGYPKQSGLRPLQFTENDVTALADVLVESGYRPENVVLMTDATGREEPHLLPERRKIVAQAQALLRDRGRADSIVVAFAGHGVQFTGDEDSYFCPLDARVEDRETLVSMGELYDDLKECPAGFKVLLSDACRDDPVAASSRGLSLLSAPEARRPPPPGGVAVFYSCSPGEFAYEDADLGHGVFFNFVIEGLRGDADLDEDGEITLPELEYHSKRRVSDYVRAEFGGNQQMPNLKGNTLGLVPLVRLGATAEGGESGAVSNPTTTETAPSVASLPVEDGDPGEAQAYPGTNSEQVVFSPDGLRVAGLQQVGRGESGVRIWDTVSGRILADSNPTNVAGLAFTPDGKAVIGVDWVKRTPVLVDATTGELRSPWFEVPNGGRAMAVLPKMPTRVLMTERQLLTLRVPGEPGTTVRPVRGDYSDLAVSADGSRCVGGGPGPSTSVFDLYGRRPATVLPGSVSIHSVAISANGRRVASAAEFVHVWDVDSRKRLFKSRERVADRHGVALTPDGTRLLYVVRGDSGFQLVVRAIDRGVDVARFRLRRPCFDIDVHPGGRLAVTGGETTLWRLPSADAPALPDVSPPVHPRQLAVVTIPSILSATFSPDGRYLVTGHAKLESAPPPREVGEIRVWAADTLKSIRTTEIGHPPLSLRFLPDGRRVLAVRHHNQTPTLAAFDTATGQLDTGIRERYGVREAPHDMVILDDDETEALLTPYHTLEYIRNGKRRVLAEGRQLQSRFAVSRDRKRFAFTDANHAIHVRAIGADTDLRTLPPVLGQGPRLEFADGGRLLVGRQQSKMRAWDVESGEELWTRSGLSGNWTLAVAADGSHVVYGGDGATQSVTPIVVVVDGRTGKNVDRFKAHESAVRAVAVSPTGRTFVTASSQELKLWRLVNQR